MARKPGIVKSFADITTPKDERGSSVTPNISSPAKFKQRKIGRSESGPVTIIKTFGRTKGQIAAQKKAAAAGKAAKASLKSKQVKFPGTEGRNIRQETLDRGKGKFPPNPKAPAKSIAQSRNANIVNKFFGGTSKVARSGGGGGGPPGTPKLSQGIFSAFRRK
jgi:hypothetical protein